MSRMERIRPELLAIPGDVMNPIPIMELIRRKNPLRSFPGG
jgi:hypothetical protein